jgi:hypothetical protein
MLASLLLAVPSLQDVPHPRPGADPLAPWGYGAFGHGLANVGDLDGDGVDELAIADMPVPGPHTLWITSGADSRRLAVYSDDACLYDFGRSISGVPDLDRDGVGDFIVGAPEGWEVALPGQVRIYSGKSCTLLRVLQAPPGIRRFGAHVVGLADVDGDGAGDLLVDCGAEEPLRCGFVYSGATGRLLHEVWSRPGLSQRRIDPIGDADGDGVPDLALVGRIEQSRTPVIRIHSGRDGRLLREIASQVSSLGAGLRTVRLPDLDRDGSLDFLLTAKGMYEAYSLASLDVLYRGNFKNDPGSSDSAPVELVGDLNRDGFEDFLLASPDEDLFYGEVEFHSARDGTLLQQIHGRTSWRNVEIWRMGTDICRLGDFDHDGIGDFAWSAENYESGSPGLVFIHSGRDAKLLRVLARGPQLGIVVLDPKG